jgi:hypothetical protein
MADTGVHFAFGVQQLDSYSVAIAPIAILAVSAASAVFLFVRWGTRWGSTSEERARHLPGDAWLENGPRAKVAMTRAISIAEPPGTVWPWIAQLGRGAGWYSWERLDNGGRDSARHVVRWIPEPRIGDAAPIGYLRHLEPGRSLTWWTPSTRFAGATARAVFDFDLRPDGAGTRLVIRMSADATGATGGLAMLIYRFVDSIMAIRQLKGIRDRAEQYGNRGSNPDDPETGAIDQYQLYEVIYASGDSAGVAGKEAAGRWRRYVLEQGLLTP